MNNLGSYGRWAFAEFREVFEIESEFKKVVEAVSQAVPMEVVS